MPFKKHLVSSKILLRQTIKQAINFKKNTKKLNVAVQHKAAKQNAFLIFSKTKKL